jgi:hypothetical protein
VCVVETALLAGIRTSQEQGASACHHVWSVTAATDANGDATEQQQQQQQQQRSLVLTGLPMAAIKTVLQQVLVTMAHGSTSSSNSSIGDDANVRAAQQPQLTGASMVRLRAQLRSAGLSTDGARGELLERLQTANTTTASAGDAATHSEDASISSSTITGTDTDTGNSGVHVINEHVHSAQHDLVIEGVQGTCESLLDEAAAATASVPREHVYI